MTDLTNWYDDLNEINALDEANNNFSSDHAKTKLIKKYNELHNTNIKKGDCVLHHLNGDYNNDTDLKNDVLIVANDRETAEKAHKLIHILSYCRIQDYLLSQLKALNVEFFYFPDTQKYPDENHELVDKPNKREVKLALADLFDQLVAHDKKLQDFNVPEDPAGVANLDPKFR